MIARRSSIVRNAVVTSVLVLVLLAATTGCSRYYWSKAGATAEQFARDNQECLGQASSTLPPGAAVEGVKGLYYACLNGRGHVRDKQIDPPPLGSYRGVESGEELAAAARTAGQTSRQSFDQQLAQLDDLKARGRITEDEYATMRRRLVEGVTPGALTPAPAAATPPVAAAAPVLAGRWYGRNGSPLEIRTAGGPQLYWEYEHLGDRLTTRATGTGSTAGERLSLTGRQTTGAGYGTHATYTFDLTRDGAVLRGTSTGPNNVPANVEFTRERR
jgi:hypothetical protein